MKTTILLLASALTGCCRTTTPAMITEVYNPYKNDHKPPITTPEPGTLILLGSGLAFVAWGARKRKTGGS